MRLVKKSTWDRKKDDMEQMKQALMENKRQMEELWDYIGRLEAENRYVTARLRQYWQNRKKAEARRKETEELWKKVHQVLCEKESRKDFVQESCGCYYNGENGKWEVVTGCGFSCENDADRLLFSDAADAVCYYRLQRIFQMQPDGDGVTVGQYLENLKRAA